MYLQKRGTPTYFQQIISIPYIFNKYHLSPTCINKNRIHPYIFNTSPTFTKNILRLLQYVRNFQCQKIINNQQSLFMSETSKSCYKLTNSQKLNKEKDSKLVTLVYVRNWRQPVHLSPSSAPVCSRFFYVFPLARKQCLNIDIHVLIGNKAN